MLISRTHLEIRVRYDEPVRDARRVLRVLPLARAGQTVVGESWSSSPVADAALESPDEWGNRRLMLRHARIERAWEFGLQLETHVGDAASPLALHAEETRKLGQWKLPSRAVDFAPALQSLGRAQRERAPLDRARYFCEFCFDEMHYRSRAEAQPPRAGQAWTRRVGSCADFAHVFLSLCRASGLAARYVAGYNPAQGQLHAWAEVLIGQAWHAFDPTHGRAPSPGCVALGVARDFYDLAPHVGSFRGEARAELWLQCRTRTTNI